MRKAVLLGLGVALVIILLRYDSDPVTSAAVSPPNPDELTAGLVPDTTLQVIVVTTDQWSENKAQVAAFERDTDDQDWRRVGGDYSARIGQNGFTDGPTTRTHVTPSGKFDLITSFGASNDPRTLIPYRKVDESDCWVTARSNPDFDRWVATPDCDAAGLGDALLDPDGPLDLAIVTGRSAVEDPTLPRRVFLRCYEYSPGRAPLPTSGDVSMRREDVLALLLWLDPAKSPTMVLGVEDWLTADEGDAAWEDLRKGDTGGAVTQLQQALTDGGIPTTVDGFFYDQTEASVRTFQEQEDVPVTGVVDEETARKLGLYSG
jgi:hypothetical protein